MILFETYGQDQIKINTQSFYKDTVVVVWINGSTISLFHAGNGIFENIAFDAIYHEDDPDPVAFTSPSELRAWIETYFYQELAIARPFTVVSEATINARGIKAGRTVLKSLVALNSGQSTRYLRIYDQVAAPDPSADVANLVMIIPIPGVTVFSVPVVIEGVADDPVSVYNQPVNATTLLPEPIRLYKGLSIAITGGHAAGDETAIGAGEVILTGTYK